MIDQHYFFDVIENLEISGGPILVLIVTTSFKGLRRMAQLLGIYTLISTSLSVPQ